MRRSPARAAQRTTALCVCRQRAGEPLGVRFVVIEDEQDLPPVQVERTVAGRLHRVRTLVHGKDAAFQRPPVAQEQHLITFSDLHESASSGMTRHPGASHRIAEGNAIREACSGYRHGSLLAVLCDCFATAGTSTLAQSTSDVSNRAAATIMSTASNRAITIGCIRRESSAPTCAPTTTPGASTSVRRAASAASPATRCVVVPVSDMITSMNWEVAVAM